MLMQELETPQAKTGNVGLHFVNRGQPTKRYESRVWRGGTRVYLGSFATAEEAALARCVARSPNGQAAAQWAAAAPVPLTVQGVRQQAQAEGLTLRRAPNKAGFYGVGINHRRAEPGRPLRPYHAKVLRGGEKVHLGIFATPEEAALCVARSPEGRATAAAAHGTRTGDARKTIRAVALDIIYEAAGAATAELSAEVAAEVMAGIAMGL